MTATTQGDSAAPAMRLIAFELLVTDARLREMADRLAASAPGLVLVSGQARSGKSTLALALAQRLAGAEQQVVVACGEHTPLTGLGGMPSSWRLLTIAPEERPIVSAAQDVRWRSALAGGALAEGAVLFVDELDELNWMAVLAAAAGRWVVAPVDTPLVGLDVAYALGGFGVSDAEILGRVRAIWSQLLVERLCEHCAAPAGADDVEALGPFPLGPPGSGLRREVGCPICAPRVPALRPGNAGLEGLCDVLLIDEVSRTECARALAAGRSPALAPAWHATIHEQALRLVSGGKVGIGTFRDTILRNPLLRAQHQLQRERSFSAEKAALLGETERLLKETEERNAELGVINSIQRGVAAHLGFQAIVDLVGDQLRSVFDVRSVGLRWFDREAGQVRFVYTRERGRRVEMDPAPLAGPLARLAEATAPWVANSPDEVAALGFSGGPPGSDGARSLLLAPITGAWRTSGYIALADHEREHRFGPVKKVDK